MSVTNIVAFPPRITLAVSRWSAPRANRLQCDPPCCLDGASRGFRSLPRWSVGFARNRPQAGQQDGAATSSVPPAVGSRRSAYVEPWAGQLGPVSPITAKALLDDRIQRIALAADQVARGAVPIAHAVLDLPLTSGLPRDFEEGL